MGFHERLPLLSEVNYQAFFNDQVFSIIHTKNLFNFEFIGKMQSNKLAFKFNYKRIFKWLLETMKAGEIYEVNSGDIYFKAPIVDQSKKIIRISYANSLENLTHAARLKFSNQNMGLFSEHNWHALGYQIDQIHRGNCDVCLCGSANENDLLWLKQGDDANNTVDWKTHVTDSNEVLFRMVNKTVF